MKLVQGKTINAANIDDFIEWQNGLISTEEMQKRFDDRPVKPLEGRFTVTSVSSKSVEIKVSPKN